ncbi:ribose-5-phosphate isomerase A [Lactiplantibacillus mudanjiangensis]|uniref:ribose-5-phosphate isomerase n=1 Tax=Lactiplantibacillus mudanjiangensis TaxID=1296538 RepID=A0A660E4I0_9LACO|nr:ribose-5-phosphate isomerase A [Lactiplantibacillus mudanjiangensis]VDG20187.1 hypothetical protein [Lactobacillus crustorum] [Lactiplantibacillus mudanjiangensis]VDG24121.1 hypothetical protein [Lactobacillus crustorum] [Lactiplantibacillus mudanjiangensis]VDG30298.1 hypothetical protein [Lactobacillus crustorum] [Lactiplantibacillus mudanjiangensis]VDG33582.1 hypothetical protein [Lactobacillus crustorum] [Lactiplantibacillus mudanjiangensis]
MIFIEAVIQTALSLIKPHTTVGLGGGHNVQNLVQALATKPALDLQVATPSELTRQTCRALGLPVLTDLPATIDIMFDGCDSLDENWHVLKSRGGIHTLEKLYAHQAKRYVILAPAERLTPTLNVTIPLCLEVVAPALPAIMQQVEQLGGHAEQRADASVASFSRTPLGNLLVDATFEQADQLITAAEKLQPLTGVIATSYFDHEMTDFITFTDDTHSQHQRKEL